MHNRPAACLQIACSLHRVPAACLQCAQNFFKMSYCPCEVEKFRINIYIDILKTNLHRGPAGPAACLQRACSVPAACTACFKFIIGYNSPIVKKKKWKKWKTNKFQKSWNRPYLASKPLWSGWSVDREGLLPTVLPRLVCEWSRTVVHRNSMYPTKFKSLWSNLNSKLSLDKMSL